MSCTAYPLTLFYDASCAVCSLEMDHLRERDRYGWLHFVDIASADFDAAAYGTTLAAMDAEIHGLTAEGTMLRGVEVLRLAYDAVGLGWVMEPTGWTPLRPLFNAGYRVFARHRRGISRAAAPLIAALRAARARRQAARMRACREGACERPSHEHRRTS